LKTKLHTFLQSRKEESWVAALALVVARYNGMPHSQTKFAPISAHYGKNVELTHSKLQMLSQIANQQPLSKEQITDAILNNLNKANEKKKTRQSKKGVGLSSLSANVPVWVMDTDKDSKTFGLFVYCGRIKEEADHKVKINFLSFAKFKVRIPPESLRNRSYGPKEIKLAFVDEFPEYKIQLKKSKRMS
jgi:hypothetical protein